MSTNHQTKENVLNEIKEIENNYKISINTEKNLRETRAIAAIKNNPKYFYKFVKNNSKIRAGIGPLQDEEGTCPKDFFGHPEGNTLSDINITREDIIDAIKTISQNSSGGPNEFPAILLKQCSKSLAHPLQLLYKAFLKTGEIPTDLK